MADGYHGGNKEYAYGEAPPPYPGTVQPPPAEGPPPGYTQAPPGMVHQYPVQGTGPPPPPFGQAVPTGYNQSAPTTVHTVQPLPATTTVIVRGNCPGCGIGTLIDQFTCCGIVLAIIFFPLGLLCCLLLRDRRCSHCGASY